MWVVDVREPTNPVTIATFPLPEEDDYCKQPGHFGPHDLHEMRPGSFQDSDTIFVTLQNAGVRAYDIRNPFQPRELAYFVPPPAETIVEPRPRPGRRQHDRRLRRPERPHVRYGLKTPASIIWSKRADERYESIDLAGDRRYVTGRRRSMDRDADNRALKDRVRTQTGADDERYAGAPTADGEEEAGSARVRTLHEEVADDVIVAGTAGAGDALEMRNDGTGVVERDEFLAGRTTHVGVGRLRTPRPLSPAHRRPSKMLSAF